VTNCISINLSTTHILSDQSVYRCPQYTTFWYMEHGWGHFTSLYCVLTLVHMHKWIQFQQHITEVIGTTIKTEEQKPWHRKALLQFVMLFSWCPILSPSEGDSIWQVLSLQRCLIPGQSMQDMLRTHTWQAFLSALGFCPISIIPLMHHIHVLSSNQS